MCDIVNRKEKAKADKAKKKARKLEDEVRKRFEDMIRIRTLREIKSEEQGFTTWKMNEMKTYFQ